MKSKFKANVVINNDNEFLSDKIKEKELNKHLTLENKWKKISVLISNGISKSIACKELNMDIRILNKLLSLHEDQLKLYFKNTIEIRQEIKISKKSILINNCRELFDKKYSMKKIAELLGIDRRTVKKYINPNFTPYIRKTVQNKSILDNYKEYIKDLFISNVNKLKVIKRIMYGRNKFELLRNKIIYLENSKKIN